MKPNLKILIIRLIVAVIFSFVLVSIFVPGQRLLAVAVLAPALTGLAYVFEAWKK